METSSEIYDKIYQEAQDILNKYNPCEIVVKDGFATCRTESCCDEGQICCCGCNFHSNKGCTVKCLVCKLFLCHYIPLDHPAKQELMLLHEKAKGLINIGEIRSPKPEDCGRLK